MITLMSSLIEKKIGKSIKILRIDNDLEFVEIKFILHQKNALWDITCMGRHQQNGVAEGLIKFVRDG